MAAPGVDFTGRWELIVTDEFKTELDEYLKRLGQSKFVRWVALSKPVLGKTSEELIQADGGRSLAIRSHNARGTWDRKLVTAVLPADNEEQEEEEKNSSGGFVPIKVPITTYDAERVESESWWEDGGRVHVSRLRGVTLYGGGSFVSRRYLITNDDESENDGGKNARSVTYVCESTFEYNDTDKEPNRITWRFRRQSAK